MIYCYTLQFCTLLINENCLKNPKTAFNGLRRSGGIKGRLRWRRFCQPRFLISKFYKDTWSRIAVIGFARLVCILSKSDQLGEPDTTALRNLIVACSVFVQTIDTATACREIPKTPSMLIKQNEKSIFTCEKTASWHADLPGCAFRPLNKWRRYAHLKGLVDD